MITLPRCLRVAGTTTYGTAIGGTNTVFIIEPIDLEATGVFAIRRKFAREALEDQWEQDARTWTDATGKFSVLAVHSVVLR